MHLYWITFRSYDCACHCHSHEERMGIRAESEADALTQFYAEATPGYCFDAVAELAPEWLQPKAEGKD